MKKYYINNQAQGNGDHEVHQEGCGYMPGDRTYLGEFSNCQDALRKGRQYYQRADGCSFCSPACHTR